MKIEELHDDIVNNIIKLINCKDISNILKCSKRMNNNFYNYGLFKKNFYTFYKNRLKNVFIGNLDNKINDLFSENFEKFKYIKLDNTYIDPDYGGINEVIGKEIFEIYNADYICALDNNSELYILLRFKRDENSLDSTNSQYPPLTRDDTYDYFYFNNVNNEDYYCSHAGYGNIVYSKNYYIENHTYHCGCGQIFTCTNNNVCNISKDTFKELIHST